MSTEIESEFREQIAQWTAARQSAKKANPLFKRLHLYYLSVRELPEGISALIALLGDSDPNVRSWAAAHLLPFLPAAAEPVLDELASRNDLIGADAKYTLIAFRSGKLDLDWS